MKYSSSVTNINKVKRAGSYPSPYGKITHWRYKGDSGNGLITGNPKIGYDIFIGKARYHKDSLADALQFCKGKLDN